MTLNNINKNAIKKWVAELRSGKYIQCRGNLVGHNGGYCCLGVACETFRKETGKGEWKPDESDGGRIGFSIDDTFHVSYLPPQVAEFYGFYHQIRNPMLHPYNISPLASTEANDVHKFTFNEIADMIEDTYLCDEQNNS